jgi:deoxyguanosine kinase
MPTSRSCATRPSVIARASRKKSRRTGKTGALRLGKPQGSRKQPILLKRRTYIAVEGPIGVGKTTLAQVLGKELNARLILEDADNNPFLPRFYEDPDKYAFPAQLYFLLTRYNQQRELSQQDLFAQMTVADYLFSKDRIFANLNLSPDELKLYEGVYDLLNAEMAKPDLVVYVRARVEVLADRLRKRNRDFERDISFEYLERVSAAYRDFFFYFDEAPLLVVDTSDIDFVANPDDLADLVREINNAGEGTQHFVPRKG